MKLTILITACAATLAACATPNPTENIIANDPFIGKDLWVPLVSLASNRTSFAETARMCRGHQMSI